MQRPLTQQRVAEDTSERARTVSRQATPQFSRQTLALADWESRGAKTTARQGRLQKCCYSLQVGLPPLATSSNLLAVPRRPRTTPIRSLSPPRFSPHQDTVSHRPATDCQHHQCQHASPGRSGPHHSTSGHRVAPSVARYGRAHTVSSRCRSRAARGEDRFSVARTTGFDDSASQWRFGADPAVDAS